MNDFTSSALSTFDLGASATVSLDADAVHRKLHHVLERLKSRDHLHVLDEEPETSLSLILPFLFKRLMAAETQGIAAADIGSLYQTQRGREAVEGMSKTSIPAEARYQLRANGVQLSLSVEEASSFLFDDHWQSARNAVESIVQDTTSRLVEHGARILVLGDRGAGKSSLINAAFGQEVASAGAGRAVTEKIQLYQATESCPVNLYDTKGFETLDNDQSALEQLSELIAERKRAAELYDPDDPERVKLGGGLGILAQATLFNSLPGYLYKLCFLEFLAIVA